MQIEIPFFGVDRQYANIREEILTAIDQVYLSGKVLDGNKTKEFEQAIAVRTNREHAIAVNSCTQGLIFSLRSLRYFKKYRSSANKILIPAQSFIASVNAVVEANFEPIFCDVDALSGLMNLSKIPIPSNELSAIMHVNLFGNMIDYDKLKVLQAIFIKDEIPIIEDAAQSFGASYKGQPSGSFGDVSCLSFDPTKNLSNYGSGGMILTDEEEIAIYCLNSRDNSKLDNHYGSGTNSKMSESDCAQMLVKLKYFDGWQERRREIANYYSSELNGLVQTPCPDKHVKHAWSRYVIHTTERKRLMYALTSVGVETRIHYDPPLPLQSHRVRSDSCKDMFEGAISFSDTCMSLPIYPELLDSEVETVVRTIKNWVN